MNITDLTIKEIRVVIQIMWEIRNTMYSPVFNNTLEEAQSYDSDPASCQIAYDNMLEAIQFCKEEADRSTQVKKLLK